MTRRRSSISRRSVRPDPVEWALLTLCATVYMVEVFGGVDLLAMPLSIGGGLQLVVSQWLVF